MMVFLGVLWAPVLAQPDTPKRPEADLQTLLKLESHLQSLYERVRPAVVGLRIRATDEGSIQGSGVLVSKDGYIMTAAHCISKPGTVVEVVLDDGRVVKARNLGRYTPADAGLMKTLDDGPYPFVEIAKSSEILDGQMVIALGHPAGVPASPYRFGTILKTKKRPNYLKSSCVVEPGDSGGPLLDLQGRVIGINSHISASMDENYHSASDPYLEHWDRMKAGETFGEDAQPKRPLGLRLKFEKRAGRITVVRPDSPAKEAGLQVGDVITHVNGKRLSKAKVLKKVLAEAESLEFKLKRDEEEIELTVPWYGKQEEPKDADPKEKGKAPESKKGDQK